MIRGTVEIEIRRSLAVTVRLQEVAKGGRIVREARDDPNFVEEEKRALT